MFRKNNTKKRAVKILTALLVFGAIIFLIQSLNKKDITYFNKELHLQNTTFKVVKFVEDSTTNERELQVEVNLTNTTETLEYQINKKNITPAKTLYDKEAVTLYFKVDKKSDYVFSVNEKYNNKLISSESVFFDDRVVERKIGFLNPSDEIRSEFERKQLVIDLTNTKKILLEKHSNKLKQILYSNQRLETDKNLSFEDWKEESKRLDGELKEITTMYTEVDKIIKQQEEKKKVGGTNVQS